MELLDNIWDLAWNIKATYEVMEVSVDKVLDGCIKPKETGVSIQQNVGTGKFKNHFPIRDLVKLGTLKIVEKPENKKTIEEMRKAIIEVQGYELPKDVPLEKIQTMYDLIAD